MLNNSKAWLAVTAVVLAAASAQAVAAPRAITGTADVYVLRRIEATPIRPLDFGTIALSIGSGARMVVLDTQDNAQAFGAISAVLGERSGAVAVTGEPNAPYTASAPSSVQATIGLGTYVVDQVQFRSVASGTPGFSGYVSTFSDSGTDELRMGGRLKLPLLTSLVGLNLGPIEIQVPVTVNYQ